jgi:hypothetical protein
MSQSYKIPVSKNLITLLNASIYLINEKLMQKKKNQSIVFLRSRFLFFILFGFASGFSKTFYLQQVHEVQLNLSKNQPKKIQKYFG